MSGKIMGTVVILLLALPIYLIYCLILLILGTIVSFFGVSTDLIYFGGLIFGGILAILVSILLAYFWLAPKNRWFTFVKEGTAKAVVKGDAVIKVLLQYKGYTLDDDWNIIPEDTWTKNGRPLIERDGKLFEKIIEAHTSTEEGRKKITMKEKEGKLFEKTKEAREKVEDDEEVILEEKEVEVKKENAVAPRKEPWHTLGGFRYYGFYPFKDVYIYDFTWTGINENGEIIPHPKESLDYVIVKDDIYFAKVEEAEDINRLPLTLELIFTLRVVNPFKALFVAQNWLEMVLNRSRTVARDMITNKSYEDWTTEKKAIGSAIVNKLIEREVYQEEFIERYGIEARAVEAKDINPGEEFRKATLQKRLAEYDREKIVVEADAEKQRISTVYEAVKSFEDLGRLIRVCEAVEKSPLAASLSVQAIPGIQEVLRGVFSKSPGDVTNQDMKEFVRAVREFKKEQEEKQKNE